MLTTLLASKGGCYTPNLILTLTLTLTLTTNRHVASSAGRLTGVEGRAPLPHITICWMRIRQQKKPKTFFALAFYLYTFIIDTVCLVIEFYL